MEANVKSVGPGLKVRAGVKAGGMTFQHNRLLLAHTI